MAKISLTPMVVNRFIRTLLPQLMIALPIITSVLMENKDYVPVWVLPTIAFAGSIVTAMDKLYRELGK